MVRQLKAVHTVRGGISPDRLGKTLVHEHLVASNIGWFVDATRWPKNRDRIVEVGLRTMSELKECGVETYVDVTTNEMGRDPEILKHVSEESGVNIVCCTGLYTDVKGTSDYFKYIDSFIDGVKEVADLFVKEITEGIQGTGIRAGVIKVSTGFGCITHYEEVVLKAAALAQNATGVPILTHTEAGTMGPEQASFLVSNGADPKRVAIGHAGGSADFRYHTQILEQGVYLAFDRFGLDAEIYHAGPDKYRIACVSGLVHMGYEKQILLSHDAPLSWLGLPTTEYLLPKETTKNWYPTHLFKDVFPRLRAAGVTERQIDGMMVDNPRRLFEG